MIALLDLAEMEYRHVYVRITTEEQYNAFLDSYAELYPGKMMPVSTWDDCGETTAFDLSGDDGQFFGYSDTEYYEREGWTEIQFEDLLASSENMFEESNVPLESLLS